MSATLEARIAALERRLSDLAKLLIPSSLAKSTLAVVDTGSVQTVQATLDPLRARDAMPVLYNFGHTGSPPIGSDLHVTFRDNHPSKAVVVASGHQEYRLGGLGVGDSALYDMRGAYVWLTATGPSINGAGKPTLITGDLHVTGNVYGGFGGADQVGLLTHKHGVGAAATGTVAPTPST